jgi:hypothetical protein
MTHCRSVVEKPSARWADGSAIFTMVASSTTISWAAPTTARISQRRLPRSRPAVAAGAAGAGTGGAAGAGRVAGAVLRCQGRERVISLIALPGLFPTAASSGLPAISQAPRHRHRAAGLGRQASRRRQQVPLMGQFTGLALAQAQCVQRGRCPATGPADGDQAAAREDEGEAGQRPAGDRLAEDHRARDERHRRVDTGDRGGPYRPDFRGQGEHDGEGRGAAPPLAGSHPALRRGLQPTLLRAKRSVSSASRHTRPVGPARHAGAAGLPGFPGPAWIPEPPEGKPASFWIRTRRSPAGVRKSLPGRRPSRIAYLAQCHYPAVGGGTAGRKILR